jgi:hypothetical protein
MLIGPQKFKVNLGDVVRFTYKDKVREVMVERIVSPPMCGTPDREYINGPELTDGGQIKSFTVANVQGEMEVIKSK